MLALSPGTTLDCDEALSRGCTSSMWTICLAFSWATDRSNPVAPIALAVVVQSSEWSVTFFSPASICTGCISASVMLDACECERGVLFLTAPQPISVAVVVVAMSDASNRERPVTPPTCAGAAAQPNTYNALLAPS
eukprot:9502821-Pyramimonas_sp.AAC.1